MRESQRKSLEQPCCGLQKISVLSLAVTTNVLRLFRRWRTRSEEFAGTGIFKIDKINSYCIWPRAVTMPAHRQITHELAHNMGLRLLRKGGGDRG